MADGVGYGFSEPINSPHAERGHVLCSLAQLQGHDDSFFPSYGEVKRVSLNSVELHVKLQLTYSLQQYERPTLRGSFRRLRKISFGQVRICFGLKNNLIKKLRSLLVLKIKYPRHTPVCAYHRRIRLIGEWVFCIVEGCIQAPLTYVQSLVYAIFRHANAPDGNGATATRSSKTVLPDRETNGVAESERCCRTV